MLDQRPPYHVGLIVIASLVCEIISPPQFRFCGVMFLSGFMLVVATTIIPQTLIRVFLVTTNTLYMAICLNLCAVLAFVSISLVLSLIELPAHLLELGLGDQSWLRIVGASIGCLAMLEIPELPPRKRRRSLERSRMNAFLQGLRIPVPIKIPSQSGSGPWNP